MKKITCFLFVSFIMMGVIVRAQTILMSVEGTKQGVFKSESTRSKAPNKMDVTGYEMEVKSPRDPASGMSTGRKMSSPIIVLKPAGASSPMFMEALSNNETLKKVVIDIYRIEPNGAESIFMTITLENASVSNYKQTAGALGNEKFKTASNIIYDEVRFVYQKITFENKVAGTTTTNNWAHSF